MIEEIFEKTLLDLKLLKKKDRLILGVSGGPDSIGMLYLFSSLRKKYKLDIVCAHFNHSLRKESDEEETFLKQQCDELNIKMISDKKDVNLLFKGDSLEQTARNLRLDFFFKCSRETKIKKIALAHHKDDLAETVLMRLIRGAGLRGLRGFLPKTKFKNLTIIRPMVNLSKQKIVDWLDTNGIHYKTDKTNFEDKFFRNRIRLKLMPLLKDMNANIVDNLNNLAYNVSLDYDFIYNFSYEKFISLKKKEVRNAIYLDLDKLKELSVSIFSNVIRIAIEELKGDTRRVEAKHMDEIRDLVFNRPYGSVVDLPCMSAKKEEKILIIQSLIL
ncbi:MAG: tRNA lysidine(34) synthetase TilS [Candidatus Omnitrophica bacterium]|nr:tRNA lysidine(34) synthetase TilS [Candidatus Omnitrophota bacterium]